jgi:tetratricopeptide (TPR) repeat protein
MTHDPVGTLDVALKHAEALLTRDPRLAIEQSDAILEAVPNQPDALLIKGQALRSAGRTVEARALLDALSRAQPRLAEAHYQLGQACAAVEDSEAAIAAFQDALALKDDFPAAWRALGDVYWSAGATTEADDAYANQIRTSSSDPRLMQAGHALCSGQLAVAERALRTHLHDQPTDVAAIRMLAEVGARLGRYGDAEKLLARCLELAPSFAAARHNFALVLFRQGKTLEALHEIDTLRQHDPDNAVYRNLQASALARLGEYGDAIALYERLIGEQPNIPRLWLSYGHALKTAGRSNDAIAAYRRAAEIDPQFGDAYWSLANLKTFRFAADEIDAMRKQLEHTDLREEDRFHIDFALGKALEDSADYAGSFAHYAQGARRRRALVHYDGAEISEQAARTKAVFNAGFLDTRTGWGAPAPDPIFIVGLPRSGSTLLEQILSSHSAIEGTMELPDITALARELGEKKLRSEASKYPEVLAGLSPDQLRALGRNYIERTRVQRKTAKPLFIDKMPNNWLHVGLIALILPNAKIIDARRHPMATCFSAFKQHFARGQAFSYDLAELGRYYKDYIDLMAHFDAVAPGRVHRILYERLVTDPETEIRRVLAYCKLDFEPACLEFYATERPVRTASSEQVRQPIFTYGVEQWRRYEQWLAPLREALGSAATYPPASNPTE